MRGDMKYLSVLSQNAGKYGPEITHAVQYLGTAMTKEIKTQDCWHRYFH